LQSCGRIFKENPDEDNNPTEQEGQPLKTSPFDYATSYWIKHAMDVPPGKNTTSRSETLWELVRDFFWDQNATIFMEWLRVYEGSSEEWHQPPTKTSGCYMCLSNPGDKAQIRSGLHVAASYGLVDILEWAHPDGIDFETKTTNRWTPLMLASFVEGEKAVKVLLSKPSVDVNRARCDSGSKPCEANCGTIEGTALHFAVIGHSVESIKLLLRQPGVEVDLVSHATTALGLANYYFQECVDLLVGAGATVSLRS
jgi:hypothetical protein